MDGPIRTAWWKYFRRIRKLRPYEVVEIFAKVATWRIFPVNRRIARHRHLHRQICCHRGKLISLFGCRTSFRSIFLFYPLPILFSSFTVATGATYLATLDPVARISNGLEYSDRVANYDRDDSTRARFSFDPCSKTRLDGYTFTRSWIPRRKGDSKLMDPLWLLDDTSMPS